MSWWPWSSKEEEEEQPKQPPLSAQIVERLTNSPKMIAELAVRIAESVLVQYPKEIRAMVIEGTDLAVQRWRDEATAKIQQAVEELINAPAVMRRMDAIEQGQQAMQGQLSQVLAMVTDYLQHPAAGNKQDDPRIADILRRLEILERRQGNATTSPRPC